MPRARLYNETPTLLRTISAIIDNRLVDVHTMLPARVVSYDAQNQTADVKVEIRRIYEDGSRVELPVFSEVPVIFPRTANAFIHLPVKEGDNVMLIFSERSLDAWRVGNGTVTPDSTRKFNYSDAVAIPGMFQDAKAFEVDDPDAITIKNGQGVLELNDDGTFKFSNGSDELVEVLIQLLEDLINAQVVTAIGPQNFLASTILKLNQVKTKLEGFKDA